MAGVAAITQERDQLRGAFWQNDVAIEHHGVAGKMRGFFRCHVDQTAQLIPDCVLSIFIERRRKPNGSAIRQRTKAGIDVIKARIDQLDRDDQATQDIGDGPMGVDVGPKLVPAKKYVATEESITFPFEIKIFGQPSNLIAMFFHPMREMRRFACPFFVPEIARDETSPDCETGVCSENHVGKLRTRRDELDLAIEL